MQRTIQYTLYLLLIILKVISVDFTSCEHKLLALIIITMQHTPQI